MTRTVIALAGLLMALGTDMLQAQTPPRPAGPPVPPAAPGEVRGIVADSEGNVPIAGASIAVRLRSDSSLVAGAVARENGAFVVPGLRPGTYYLRVAAIGFTPRTSDEFTITDAAPRANVGAIELTRFAVTLQTVDVTVEQPTVLIEPDRNSYRAQDIAPAASSASDVLQSTPSIEVDGDGKVSLRGNENVAVQINGRPAPIRGAQLGAYLRQLPASVVDRVEVVPTPSARHDPEGMAGIINIVLKQNTDLGWSGGYNLSVSPAQRYSASGNVGYQVGPLTLFSTYGFNANETAITGLNARERYDALRAPLSFTEQDVDGEQEFAGHNFNTTVDYKLNGRDNLYNALAINRRRSADASLSAYSELTGDRTITDQYLRLRDGENRGLMFDYTTAFKRTFEPRRHELAAELRYNRQDDEEHTALWREPVTPGGRTELEDNIADALSQRLTAQLDYTRTVWQRTKLETGYKGESRWLDREYTALRDRDGTGTWVRGDMSNGFEFDEQVHAVYGVLSHGVGKWELQGGLRAEYATREFALTAPAESHPYSYTSLFPSGVASYKLSDASQAKLSYSRRIRRPGTQELNPFPVFFDAQIVFIGNPRLNPEYTDAVELGLSRMGRLGMVQFSPFYRRTTDIIRFIADPDVVIDGREVTSVTFQNLATGTSWGTDLNGQLRLGPMFTALAGFNVYKIVTDGGSESSLASDAVTWSGRLNATLNVSRSTTLQGFYFYRAPMNFEQGRFSKFQMANFTVRQRLDERKTLTLRFADPFNTSFFRAEAGQDNIWQITQRSFNQRAVHLGFQYRFGQAPRIRQPQPQQPQEPQPGFPTG